MPTTFYISIVIKTYTKMFVFMRSENSWISMWTKIKFS